jgi:hypothetical protein
MENHDETGATLDHGALHGLPVVTLWPSTDKSCTLVFFVIPAQAAGMTKT